VKVDAPIPSAAEGHAAHVPSLAAVGLAALDEALVTALRATVLRLLAGREARSLRPRGGEGVQAGEEGVEPGEVRGDPRLDGASLSPTGARPMLRFGGVSMRHGRGFDVPVLPATRHRADEGADHRGQPAAVVSVHGLDATRVD
jgi:hypothetical protein